MKISNARKAAFENLVRIERDSAYSSELLANIETDMEERDRRLVYALTMGVLRNQLLLDNAIDHFSKVAVKRMDVEIAVILRLGLFQLAFMDRIPGYSAVNESVELARFAKKRSASGLVNAVLRKAGKWNREPIGIDSDSEIAIKTSHPEWLIMKWELAFGKEQAASLAVSNNTEPPSTFRLTRRFDQMDSAKKQEILREFEEDPAVSRSSILESAFETDRIDAGLRRKMDDGVIYFQDMASQLAGQVVVELSGRNILDLCAAPGSKTTQIARAVGSRAGITAGEFHFRRALNLMESASKQGCAINTVVLDAETELPFKQDYFDTVLVDAPCSGTGTIRRNPEIRYRISQSDIEELNSKQTNILTNASKLVGCGATLIYTTCSLEREENEDVIRAFLMQEHDFDIVTLDFLSRFVTQDGFARTFPDRDNCDGFFIACLRRK